MIRLYRDFVLQIRGVLRWIEESIPTEKRDVLDRIVLDYSENGEGFQTYRELADLLDKQLSQSENYDKDLIDVMVEVLQLPYTQNRLTVNTLLKLKRALLLPDEFNALREELKRKELYCMGCNRSLQDQEVTVIRRDGGDIRLYCAACSKPNFIACKSGKHTLTVGKPLLNTWMKATEKCETCENIATSRPEPTGPQVRQPVAQDEPVGLPVLGGRPGQQIRVGPPQPIWRVPTANDVPPMNNAGEVLEFDLEGPMTPPPIRNRRER